jgi:phage terminase large subunit-like protein
MTPDDPIRFIENTLIDPETRQLFVLTAAERVFLRHAFDLTQAGRLRYPELVFAAPKKSGKTAFAAMIAIYVVRVLGGRFAEGYILANSHDQAALRVFQAAARIIEASPLLAQDAKVTGEKITFASTGATIAAIPSDYSTAAGANPSISIFDELWGFTSERDHRLFDEMSVPPTRSIACRLTVSYAGFEGESELLEGIYKRGIAGEQIAPDLYASGGLLLYWTHEFTASWQTTEWREQMRETLRPNAYLRLIENRWVTTESEFIDIAWWDRCTDLAAGPLIEDRQLPVWLGVDASTKRDSTAIVACTYDRGAKKVRLVWHRTFQPSPEEPLDFEHTVEATIIDLSRRFRLRQVRFDPYQMQASAQRLTGRGVPTQEFPQTVGNLTEASSNLYELVKGHNLMVYEDAAMRLAVQRSVAIETSRGWRIAKEKASHKIDVVVALAQAALAAVEDAAQPDVLELFRRMGRDDAPVAPAIEEAPAGMRWATFPRQCIGIVVQDGGKEFVIEYAGRQLVPDWFALHEWTQRNLAKFLEQ